jgi:hypothetical protein
MKNCYLIFIFLIICGCNEKKNNSPGLCYANRDYRNELSEMPPFLVAHFPDEIDRLPISSLITTDTTSRCICYMLFEYGKDKAFKLQKQIGEKHLAKYKSSDENLILIKSESIRSMSDDKTSYDNIYINNKYYYPLPFFRTYNNSQPGDSVKTEDIYSNNTKCGLSRDFLIYILDSKPGHYWKGLYPLNYMPVDWKNGYSKGICINEKKGIIIYWGLIW